LLHGTMDVAYDHIQEETFPEDEEKKKGQDSREDGPAPQSINEDFQEAYKAFTTSPWGAKLGGFWATAKKQVRAGDVLAAIGL
jgi:hypothetical protein